MQKNWNRDTGNGKEEETRQNDGTAQGTVERGMADATESKDALNAERDRVLHTG